MQNAKNYLTLKGWKADLDETVNDLKDIGIVVKRALGLSSYWFENEEEMTSKEREDLCFRSTAYFFGNEQDFLVYAMTHPFPLGRSVIGYGKDPRRYDDSALFCSNAFKNKGYQK